MVAIPANLRVKYAPIADVRPYEDNPRHNDETVVYASTTRHVIRAVKQLE